MYKTENSKTASLERFTASYDRQKVNTWGGFCHRQFPRSRMNRPAQVVMLFETKWDTKQYKQVTSA